METRLGTPLATFSEALVLTLLFATTAIPSSAQQYVFRSVDVPGVAGTLIGGNNNSGVIAGCYQMTGPSSDYLAFVLNDAKFTVAEYPNAVSTCVNGVSGNGKYAGAYAKSDGIGHGFLLSNKTFKSIDYPNAAFTEAYGVNDSGIVSGDYSDGSAYHGFTWHGGTFTHVDFPGASNTYVTGINDSGDVVGTYTMGGTYHGFLLSGGNFSTIDYPGSIYTSLFGINNLSQIVGFYYNSDTVNHGFSDFAGIFSTLDYPGAASAAIGINDSGQVVGQWFGGGSNPSPYDEHGYLATPAGGSKPAVRGVPGPHGRLVSRH
ncbi:MAG: hypothetical protein ACRD3L_12570 [Terriglobales bacterium]